MSTAADSLSHADHRRSNTPGGGQDEATIEYVVRLRDALAALYDDPLSLEAGRNVSALL